MTVVADHVAPAHAEVASADAVEAVISNIRFSAKTEQDRLEMFHLATEASTESHLKYLKRRVIRGGPTDAHQEKRSTVSTEFRLSLYCGDE